MKLVVGLFTTLTFSVLALSETSTLTIEGMHCSACKSMVSKSVCENPTVKESAEKCTVKFNSKTKLGTVTVVAKENQKIDTAVVEAAILATDDAYKVTKKETK